MEVSKRCTNRIKAEVIIVMYIIHTKGKYDIIEQDENRKTYREQER